MAAPTRPASPTVSGSVASAAVQPGLIVTVSAGTATVPTDAEDGAELVSVADRALYNAKRAGRDRVGIAPPRP